MLRRSDGHGCSSCFLFSLLFLRFFFLLFFLVFHLCFLYSFSLLELLME